MPVSVIGSAANVATGSGGTVEVVDEVVVDAEVVEGAAVVGGAVVGAVAAVVEVVGFAEMAVVLGVLPVGKNANPPTAIIKTAAAPTAA